MEPCVWLRNGRPCWGHFERDLFADFGGATGVARVMTGPGKVQTFMEKEPRKVAAYVWECLEYRRTEAPDLIPYVSRQELEPPGSG